MKRSEFRHLERLRVRRAEVDLQKIVFNGHYLMYFDTAVAGCWRALALPYADSMAALGGDLYVRKASLDYLGSARYDEQLDIGMRCAHIGNSSLRFAAAVCRGQRLLVQGELVYVFADAVAQQARPVPAPLRALLQAYEAGEAVLELRTGIWAALGADARSIRQAVFVDEQGVDAERVVDAADDAALHAVAYNRLGVPVASGRLLQRELGLAQVRPHGHAAHGAWREARRCRAARLDGSGAPARRHGRDAAGADRRGGGLRTPRLRARGRGLRGRRGAAPDDAAGALAALPALQDGGSSRSKTSTWRDRLSKAANASSAAVSMAACSAGVTPPGSALYVSMKVSLSPASSARRIRPDCSAGCVRRSRCSMRVAAACASAPCARSTFQ